MEDTVCKREFGKWDGVEFVMDSVCHFVDDDLQFGSYDGFEFVGREGGDVGCDFW